MATPDEVSLRVYLESLIASADQRYSQRFDAQEKAVTSALAAAKEAVIKAEIASDKRFEGVNEFRAALSDQQRTLMPRAEVEAINTAHEKEVFELKKRLDALAAERAGIKGGWGYAVGVAGLVALLIGGVLTVLNLSKG